jgi:hypothetical protein
MHKLLRRVLVIVSLGALYTTVAAAQPAAFRALIGEWTGTLVLDNSSPRVALVFDAEDTLLTGKVYSDASLLGPMEGLSLKRDTVHFKVDRLDFTGRINGPTMTVDLIVYNGSHRALTLKKTPEMRREPASSRSALEEHVLYDSSYHRSRRVWIYTPAGYDATIPIASSSPARAQAALARPVSHSCGRTCSATFGRRVARSGAALMRRTTLRTSGSRST